MTSLEEWRLSGVDRSTGQDSAAGQTFLRDKQIVTGAQAFRQLADNAASKVLRYQGETYVLAPDGEELPDGVLGIAFHVADLPNGPAAIGSAQPLALLLQREVPASAAPDDEREGQRVLIAQLANPVESLGVRVDRLDFLRAAYEAAQAVTDPVANERIMQRIRAEAVAQAGLSAEAAAHALAMDDETWNMLAGLLRSIA